MKNIFERIKDYDTVVVDLDNTVFNYSKAHDIAKRAVLAKFNITDSEYELADRAIKKRSLRANHHRKELYFKHIQEERGLPLVDAFKMISLYNTAMEDNITRDDQMVDALERFSGKVVAVTNFYTVEQLTKLWASESIHCINMMLTSEEFEIEKPSTIFKDRILDVLNDNDQFKSYVMIGDSVVDEQFATNCGFDFIPYNCAKVIIGIAGKSGAGKSTLSSIIKSVYQDAVLIEADGYHKYERGHHAWHSLTHYNPRANNLIQLGMDVRSIFHDTGKINIPLYSHDTGKLTDSKTIRSSAGVFIIDGLHTLYPEVAGDYIRYKVFIDSDFANEQKIDRDSISRDKTISQVIDSIAERDEDYVKYIETQQEFANINICCFKINDEKRFKITISNDIIVKSKLEGRFEDMESSLKSLFTELLQGY